MSKIFWLRRNTAAMLYACYIYLLCIVLVAIGWTAVILTPGFSRSYGTMRFFAKMLFRLGGVVINVDGLNHLTQLKQYVLVANHCSYVDGPVLAAILPVRISFVVKRELARNVACRLFLKRIRTNFVERFNNRKGSADARHVIRAARKGRSFVFFPEGTFYRTPGLRPFRMGAFLTAVRAGVPIVPIVIRGSRSLLCGDTWFPRNNDIYIRVCDPIRPEGGDWGDAVKLRDAARAQILKYSGEPDLSR